MTSIAHNDAPTPLLALWQHIYGDQRGYIGLFTGGRQCGGLTQAEGRARLPANGTALRKGPDMSIVAHHTTDAGILDLEYEIRSTPSAELADQISLLIEALEPLASFARARLRLATWELRRRLAASEVAA